MEMADEAYIKKCMTCGNRIEKPVLYKGYAFCSESCKRAFLAKESSSNQWVVVDSTA